MTIGAQSTSIHGPNAAITFDSNLYGTAENWSVHYGYKVLEDAVSNSSIPIYAASTYHGDADMEVITTSDNDFLSKITLTNGDLSTRTATIAYKDVSGITKTTSITGRWHEIGHAQRKSEFVRFTLKCVLSAVPTGF